MIVKVESPVRRATMARLADACDTILFDVSNPSDNLVGETETLLAKHADSCLHIGQLDTLRRHHGLHVERRIMSPDTPVTRVDRLLDGRTVVSYRSDPAGLPRFRRALRAGLERCPVVRTSRSPRVAGTRSAPRPRAVSGPGCPAFAGC